MRKAVVLISFLSVFQVYAQDELLRTWNELMLSRPVVTAQAIPIKLALTDAVNIGNSAIRYFEGKNDFRDAFMPEKQQGFDVRSERFVSVNGWDFYGRFSFSKYEDSGSRFTAMADPYRENPYKIADSVEADWRKQHYLLETKMVSPLLFRKFRAGLGMRYEIRNGARQRDPRPLDKIVEIELTPYVLYHINPKWTLGLNGYYFRFREDLSVSLENTQRPRNIYKLLGLGEYLYNGPVILTGGVSRLYKGNSFGSGISVAYTPGESQFIQAGVQYKKHDEDVTDGTSSPFYAGNHKYSNFDLRVDYLVSGSRMSHRISLDYNHFNTDNTEFIQQFNNTTGQYEVLYASEMHHRTKDRWTLDYSGLRKDVQKRLLWGWDVSGNLYDHTETYPTTQSRREMTGYEVQLGGRRWIYLKQTSVEVGYQTLYRNSLESAMVYFPGTASTDFVAANITFPNFYYENMPAWTNRLYMQVNLPYLNNKGSQLYIRASYERISALENNAYYTSGLHNNGMMVTVGLYN